MSCTLNHTNIYIKYNYICYNKIIYNLRQKGVLHNKNNKNTLFKAGIAVLIKYLSRPKLRANNTV